MKSLRFCHSYFVACVVLEQKLISKVEMLYQPMRVCPAANCYPRATQSSVYRARVATT